MYFDPFHENLFGQPLGVWIAVAVIFATPFVVVGCLYWWWDRHPKHDDPAP